MTDQDLLTDAAHAAGITWLRWDRHAHELSDEHGIPWNPLINNRDAHELSVLIGICIDHDFIEVAVHEYRGYKEGEYKQGVRAWIVPTEGPAAGSIIECSEVYDSDPLAATRRAIVRVAAELGRRMKK